MNRVEELKNLINYYDKEYYDNDRSLINDLEYDALMREYINLGGVYDVVPGGASKGNGKTLHTFTVKSLDKINTEDELRAELIRLSPGMAQEKLDGLTVIVYPDMENCELSPIPAWLVNTQEENFVGATRGAHGVEGEIITESVKKIENFDANCFNKIKAPIRSEAFMKLSAFKEINIERVKNGEKPFENARNAAAGMLRKKTTGKIKGISMMAYNIMGCSLSESAQLNMMYKSGIPVLNPQNCFKFDLSNIEEAVKWCMNFDRTALDYEIDGIVLKSNKDNSLALFGETGHHPKNAIAYKFGSQGGWTKLLGVRYQVGRTGKITPVADIEAISILGSSVESPTLNNNDKMNEIHITQGCEVYVVKANDVIPAVLQARNSNPNAIPFPDPTVCPKCGFQLVKRNSQHFCESPECGGRLLTGVVHLGREDVLNIDDLGKGTVAKMIDANYLVTPADIFKLTYEQILALDGFATKSATSLYKNIQGARVAPLDRFICSSAIPEIGRTASKDIAERFLTFGDFIIDIKGGCLETQKISGIGNKMVANIIKYQDLLGLMFRYVTPTDMPHKRVSSPLEGLVKYTFVLTGKMSSARREIESALSALGHYVENGVKNGVDYLVTGDNVGSVKTDAARKKGLKVITEEEMWKLVGRRP